MTVHGIVMAASGATSHNDAHGVRTCVLLRIPNKLACIRPVLKVETSRLQ